MKEHDGISSSFFFSFFCYAIFPKSPQNPPPPPPIASPNVQSPRDFLAERSAGPYTCLRARDLNLLGFDFHIKRLMDSIRYVYMCGLHVQIFFLMVFSLLACCENRRNHRHDHHYLLSIYRASGGSIDEKTLRHQVLDGIEENVQEAMKGQEGANKSPLDSFITIHADLKGNPTSTLSSSIDIILMSPCAISLLCTAAGSPKLSFHSLSMPYATMPPPITLEIRGEGRKNPEVKHSQVSSSIKGRSIK